MSASPDCCQQCGAALTSVTSRLGCLNCLLLGAPNESNPGVRRWQHYEICARADGTLDELGRGAMGVTYRARDVNLNSAVALKIIAAPCAEDPQARGRFHREARAAAQLRHPNVAAVFHFGETSDGHCFYAMELIEGESVAAYLQRRGPLPSLLALEIATQVTRALVAAESHGIVHRDLKPGNLMILPSDIGDPDAMTVKVIDFGLAKATELIAANAGEARRGFSGTPDFASPEQLGGFGMSVDTRSDIYSLGATLWYLLTARPPFPGRSAGDASCEPLPVSQLSLRHVPEPVINLLRATLAKEPADRPASARELLAALQRCRQVIANPSFSFT